MPPTPHPRPRHRKSLQPLHLLLLLTLNLSTTSCHHQEATIPRPIPGNDPAEQYAYGQSILAKGATPQHAAQALPWLLAAAHQGHSGAQTAVAFCLENGWGTAANPRLAEAWYQKAAHTGNRYATVALARLELDKQPRQALHHLQNAANTGYVPAQLLLAQLYITGEHTPQNPTAAVDNLRYAAMQGSGEAAFLMAICYLDGYGVPQNAALALGWLQNAADEGYTPAQEILKNAQ